MSASETREGTRGQGDTGTWGTRGCVGWDFIVGLYYENEMDSLGDGALLGLFVDGGRR